MSKREVNVSDVRLEVGAPDVEIVQHGGFDLQFGLSWDYYEGMAKVDLDCAVLAFDFAGVLTDACYYNEKVAANGSVKHSGDSQSGEESSGFDEVVTIDLDGLPPNVTLLAFVVNAFQGGDFSSVESAFAQVSALQDASGKSSKALADIAIGCGSTNSGCVLAVMHRRDGANGGPWMFRKVGSMCDGRNFQESMPAIRKVIDTFVDPGLIGERQLSMTKTFNMNKGDAVEIPADLFKGGDDLFIGLGWEAPGGMDLDASILISDGQNGCVGLCYFANKTYGSALHHKGDNRSGEGVGDDERIDVDLDKVPSFVKELFIVVNIYTDGGKFSQVKDAYVRLCAIKNGHELCRYKLDGDVHSNGLVFACLKRSPMKTWLLSALGKEASGRVCDSEEMKEACKCTKVSPFSGQNPDTESTRAGGGGGGEEGGCCVII